MARRAGGAAALREGQVYSTPSEVLQWRTNLWFSMRTPGVQPVAGHTLGRKAHPIKEKACVAMPSAILRKHERETHSEERGMNHYDEQNKLVVCACAVE